MREIKTLNELLDCFKKGSLAVKYDEGNHLGTADNYIVFDEAGAYTPLSVIVTKWDTESPKHETYIKVGLSNYVGDIEEEIVKKINAPESDIYEYEFLPEQKYLIPKAMMTWDYEHDCELPGPRAKETLGALKVKEVDMSDGYITFEVESMTKEEFDKEVPNFPQSYNTELDIYYEVI